MQFMSISANSINQLTKQPPISVNEILSIKKFTKTKIYH
jgi:hypothetical protein